MKSNGSKQKSDAMFIKSLRIQQISEYLIKHGLKCYTVPEGLVVHVPFTTKHGATNYWTEIISTYDEAKKIVESL